MPSISANNFNVSAASSVVSNASPWVRVIFSTSEPLAAASYPRWREIAEGARSYLVSREALLLLDSWLAAGDDSRPPARLS